MEIDQIIADIIMNEFQISADRIGLYGTNFKAPNDKELYIVISTVTQKILGSSNVFDQSTNEEVKTTTSFIDMIIELTSKNRDAYDRKEEAIMALTSTYSVQKQELNNFRVFRAGDIQDLTFIEGSSSLYRFRIPIKVTSLKIKRTSVEYFDKLRENEIKVNSK